MLNLILHLIRGPIRSRESLILENVALRHQLRVLSRGRKRPTLKNHSHVIVLNELHLHRVLSEYVSYYNIDRCHLALDKDSPWGPRSAWSALPRGSTTEFSLALRP
jgi:hypothetical protein